MTQRIPNQFHFVFGLKKQDEPFHLAYYLCLKSCLEVNKPEKIYFYYHHMPYGKYWDLIKDKLELEKVELVPAVSDFNYEDKEIKKHLHAHHSDFIRVEKLNERGGVYADIDTLFVNPIPEELFQKPAVLGWEDEVFCKKTNQNQPSVCNALIMLEKGSEFGKHYYSEMADSLDGTWSNHSCFLAHQIAKRFPESVHLEPKTSFYKHCWSPEGIKSLFEETDLDFNGVYSFHLWSHLWWSRWRKDFSNFHAGMMTEKHIRNVDTTYNVVARKYLPSA